MPKILPLLALTVLLVQPVLSAAPAADPPASDTSIKELFALTDAQKLLDSMYGQMEAMMTASTKAATGRQPLTPEQEKIVTDMRAKMMAVVKEGMNWSAFEPMMMDVYRKSFSQSEVDGMVRFYKSKAGQAVIAKMPVVIQSTMQAAQARMAELMPKIRQISADGVAQLRALDAQPHAPDGSGQGGAASAASGGN